MRISEFVNVAKSAPKLIAKSEANIEGEKKQIKSHWSVKHENEMKCKLIRSSERLDNGIENYEK